MFEIVLGRGKWTCLKQNGKEQVKNIHNLMPHAIAMNILTCLCCPVPDHVKTGIGYISLFAIMDAESDEP
jgi:hydroxymethylpyrimidine/phosphomethylpyrimidine kinase